MENVYLEKSSFKFSKRKALVIALSIFAIAIVVSEPAYASVPWWITGIGAVAGGIVGSLTGSPIGTIAGAAGGAMLANYLYEITHRNAEQIPYFPNQQRVEDQFAASYENMTSQELMDNEHQAITTNELFTEDYYYNAQQEEALVPYFLNQSELSCFNMSLSSGTYATLNNISESIYSPEATILFQTWYDGMISCNNGFTENQKGQTYSAHGINGCFAGYAVNGLDLVKGDYIFVFPQNLSTSLYRFQNGNVSISLQNFYTNKTYNIYSNGVLPLNTSKIPYGLYLINSTTDNVITTGIEITSTGTLDTTYTSGDYHYKSDTYDSGGCGIFSAWNVVLVNESVFASSCIASYSTTGNANNNAGWYTGSSNIGCFSDQQAFNGMPDYYTSLASNLNNIFSAANSYFNTLKTLGYTNIDQLSPSQIIPFPSDVVPSSMLNGTFNEQELQELYIAYLNDLNNTFHNPGLFNGKNFTSYVNQTMFVNGFLTVSGNLTYTSGTTTKYINETDFFIQTYTNKLYFAKGQTTNLTGEIYPVLILNGSENGTLLYVDASIYVISLSLAGKNISSYTLEPEEITYILPKVTSISPPKVPAFIVSASMTEYLIIAALVIVILAAVITGMVKKGKKDGKKRDN